MAQWRSSEMQLVQLYMEKGEPAKQTIDRLGDLGIVEFKDLQSDKTGFQRARAADVKRCDEMERRLRFLHSAVVEAKITPISRPVDRHSEPDIFDLQRNLEELEKEVRKLHSSQQTLQRTHDEVVELKCVLEAASVFFGTPPPEDIGTGDVTNDHELNSVTTSLLGADEGPAAGRGASRLGSISGVIGTARIRQFERVCWRATRGNVYIRSVPIKEKTNDPSTGEPLDKSVIAIFYSGERSKAKVSKLCDTSGVNKYECPEDPQERAALHSQTRGKLDTLREVIDRTLTTRNAVLSKIAAAVDAWQYQVKREKAIFHVLNLMRSDGNVLIAEGWVPVKHLDLLQRTLQDAAANAGASVPSVMQKLATKETPPTHFETNRLTVAFQNIVNSYGIARYQEYNPAIFTVITFPFLFAVMFGDFGHGTIMTIFALITIWKERQIESAGIPDMLKTPFAGRYCILLMGLFSMYTGAIYNDCFSLPFQLGDNSQWDACDLEMNAAGNLTRPEHCDGYYPMKAPKDGRIGSPYFFGIDPEWSHTTNKLNFYNSFKMKLSIIFGVTQMMTGNLCKLTNGLYFKKNKDVFFEFLPEIIFMGSLMGYLVLQIFMKWHTDWETQCVMLEDFNGKGVAAKQSIVTCCTRSDTPNFIDKFPRCNGFSVEPAKNGNATLLFVGDKYAGNWTGACKGSGGSLIPEMNYQTIIATNESVLSKFWQTGVCYKQPPPALLDGLINMFMDIGNVGINAQLYPGQGKVQALLVLIAVIAIPCLLFPKPCLEKSEHQKEAALKAARHSASEEEEEEEYEFSEHMVHQVIHTIEYVLGAVSNTASYLRLWALSLAHAELSEVFWEKVLVENIQVPKCEGDPTAESSTCEGKSVVTYAVTLFCGFTVWAVLTFAVLMTMESLSAFLHALRLHWVEFQNKFYAGDGRKFLPFSYAAVFDDDKEE